MNVPAVERDRVVIPVCIDLLEEPATFVGLNLPVFQDARRRIAPAQRSALLMPAGRRSRQPSLIGERGRARLVRGHRRPLRPSPAGHKPLLLQSTSSPARPGAWLGGRSTCERAQLQSPRLDLSHSIGAVAIQLGQSPLAAEPLARLLQDLRLQDSPTEVALVQALAAHHLIIWLRVNFLGKSRRRCIRAAT